MWFLPGQTPVHLGRTVVGTDGLTYSIPANSSKDEFLASIGWLKAPAQPVVSNLYCTISWDVSSETWIPVVKNFESRLSIIEEHKTYLINCIRNYAREARNALIDDTMPDVIQESIRAQYRNYLSEIEEISLITYSDAKIDSIFTSFDDYDSVVETDKVSNPDAVNLYFSTKINNLKSQPLKHSI